MGISILKGILTGLILSLPFGPIGIYCTELTLYEGRWKGYITALGMVTVDFIYSMLSLFFISQVEDFVIKYENLLSIIIALFLIFISVRKLKSEIKIKEVNVEFKSMLQNYFIGVALALANVSSILAITIIFTYLKAYSSTPSLVLLGVPMGGATFWLFTTFFITECKKIFSKDKIVKFIKFSNFLIIFLSIFIIILSLKKIFKI